MTTTSFGSYDRAMARTDSKDRVVVCADRRMDGTKPYTEVTVRIKAKLLDAIFMVNREKGVVSKQTKEERVCIT